MLKLLGLIFILLFLLSELSLAFEKAPSCQGWEFGKFSKIYFLDESVQCKDTLGLSWLYRKLSSWLPPKVKLPPLVLVMETEAQNAAFSYYSIQVPALLKNTKNEKRLNLFTNTSSRSVIAHEIGHAMLAYSLANASPEFNRDVEFGKKFGKIALDYEFQSRALESERIELVEEFVYFPYSEEKMKAYERVLQAQDALLSWAWSQSQEMEKQLTPTDHKRNDWIAPFHEFFADLVAVLDRSDWNQISAALKSADSSGSLAKGRGFIRDASVELDLRELLNPHSLLSESRYQLYDWLQKQDCLKVKPRKLIPLLVRSILRQYQKSLLRGVLSAPKTRKEIFQLNQDFVSDFISELSHSIRSHRAAWCS